jgi:hypothetical protein
MSAGMLCVALLSASLYATPAKAKKPSRPVRPAAGLIVRTSGYPSALWPVR